MLILTGKKPSPAVALLLDSARGTYIPKNFVENFNMNLWQGITADDIEILKDKDHEYYDETWNDVLDSAKFEQGGHVWRLSQDGDLWAICYELMSNEERQNFGLDEENE